MTSFLKNAWYAAAWAAEVERGNLFVRTLLGEQVLMYRKSDGTPVAIANRCPHRFAPLSMGRLIGDSVQCRYHGLRFDERGQCIHNPVGDGRIPRRASVRSYAVIERYELLWIWMGESAPDVSLLPNFDERFCGSRYPLRLVSKDNYLHLRANYLLIVDNLLDISHIPTIHETSLKERYPEINRAQIGVRPEKRRVEVSFKICGTPSLLHGTLVDQWIDVVWDAPGLVTFTSGEVAVGHEPAADLNDFAVHLITPETEQSAHYFYFVLLTAPAGSATNEEETRRLVHRIFKDEDGPIFEACQSMMGSAELLSLKPLFLNGDKAAAAARKTLAELIRQEAGEVPR